jgi:Big-like domain-containing protein
MRLNRPSGVASKPDPAGGHRARAGVVRALSVTVAAGAVCALSALPALASPAADPGSVATTTTITTPAADVYSYVNAGQAFTLTATVAATDDSDPTGTVAFTAVDDPDPVPPNMECTATVVDGTASCNVQTEPETWGFLLYEATYTPTADSEWAGSNSLQPGVDHKLVTWDITSTVLTFKPAAATKGSPVTLTADVTDEPMDALAAAASVKPDQVTFSIGGVAIPGCANVNVTDPSKGPSNIATCTYTPTTSGKVAIEAAYSGDDYALPSTDTATLTVNSPTTPKHSSKTAAAARPKTAKTRQDVKFSATVTSSGKAPTGTVTFWFGTRKLCVAKVSGGKASCAAKFYRASKKKITAKYSGDSTHDASSGTVTVTIKRR